MHFSIACSLLILGIMPLPYVNVYHIRGDSFQLINSAFINVTFYNVTILIPQKGRNLDVPVFSGGSH